MRDFVPKVSFSSDLDRSADPRPFVKAPVIVLLKANASVGADLVRDAAAKAEKAPWGRPMVLMQGLTGILEEHGVIHANTIGAACVRMVLPGDLEDPRGGRVRSVARDAFAGAEDLAALVGDRPSRNLIRSTDVRCGRVVMALQKSWFGDLSKTLATAVLLPAGLFATSS